MKIEKTNTIINKKFQQFDDKRGNLFFTVKSSEIIQSDLRS